MKTIIVSIDAAFSSDICYLSTVDSFRKLKEKSAVCYDVKPIYPALTYPCHVSMVSGNYPCVHGVNQNTVLDFYKKDADWIWYYDAVKCKTLFDDFKLKGKTTASIFWPVTANAPIDYLVPEIWSKERDSLEVMKETSSHNIDHIMERYHEILDFDDKYRQDIYGKNCAIDIINEFNPDVTFIHFCVVDQMRHKYGLNHPKINQALFDCNQWIQELLDTYRLKNNGEEPCAVLTSDHGHLACNKVLAVNTLLAQQGYYDDSDRENCKAFCHEAGVSAQIYVRDKNIRSELEKMFQDMVEDHLLFGYYDKEDMLKYGLDGDFDYSLEAADGYTTTTRFDKQPITQLNPNTGVSMIGSHGHFPERGDKPFIMVYHPRMQNEFETKGGCIVDLAATISSMMKLPEREMQGKPIEGLVNAFCQAEDMKKES